MNRAIYLANILGVDMGMYYKRLDYSKRINERHPIAAYEFLGPAGRWRRPRQRKPDLIQFDYESTSPRSQRTVEPFQPDLGNVFPQELQSAGIQT